MVFTVYAAKDSIYCRCTNNPVVMNDFQPAFVFRMVVYVECKAFTGHAAAGRSMRGKTLP